VSGDHPSCGLDAGGELPCQARLADAGLADDGNQRRVTLLDRPVEGATQSLQLVPAPDIGRVSRDTRTDLEDIHQPPGDPGSTQAVHHRTGRRFQDGGVAHQPPGGLAQQDLTVTSGLLEAGRQRHRWTGGRRCPGGGIADHDLAGADADPGGKPDAVGALRRSVHGRKVLTEREPGAHRPQGVVLVCHRHPEHGHDDVADEPLHGGSVATEHLDGGLVGLHDDQSHGLGIHQFGGLGASGPGQVGEQDRDGPAPSRQPAAGAGLHDVLGRQGVVVGLRPFQPGILREDRLLKPLERRAGFDAELVDQQRSRDPVQNQGVGLAPAPVQRQHQLRTQPLPQGMLGDQPLELGHQLGMPAQCQVCLQALLQRSQSQLLQLRDRGLRERLVGELVQRRTPPQPQRLPQPSSLGGDRRLGRLRHETTEPVGIDLVAVDGQQVPGRARLQHRRRLAAIRWLEPLPQRGHQPMECLGGGRRWRLAPQLVDQPIGGNDLAGTQCEHTQQ
jgi:hypothetical protein